MKRGKDAARGGLFPFPVPQIGSTFRFKMGRWTVTERGIGFGRGSITGNLLCKVTVWLEKPRVARAKRRGSR